MLLAGTLRRQRDSR